MSRTCFCAPKNAPRYGSLLKLHAPQSCVATHDDSALRAELEELEPEGKNAKARRLWYKPLAWLGVIRPLAQGEDWPLPLWQTFFTTTIGFPLPLLSAAPGQSKVCGCRKFIIDKLGDHVSTCTAHSAAQIAHDWTVERLACLLRTVGHVVKTQFKVTASRGRKRGDIEIAHYLHHAAGGRSLILDFCMTHLRNGSCAANPQLNGQLCHRDFQKSLVSAAKVKIDSYCNAYANDHNISFMPAVTSTSGHVHCELLRILFLQAHRETEEYFERSGLPAQSSSDFFKFKRAAFHGAIKSKAGLAFAKAAAMRVIMHIDKSPAIVMGRPARSSQQHVPRLLSSALHHNYHLPSQPPRGP